MVKESLLYNLARSSAVSIVERHASDLRNKEPLIEAVARIVLLGLQGHVKLFTQGQNETRIGEVLR